jgi:hypothetical protein
VERPGSSKIRWIEYASSFIDFNSIVEC